MRMCLFCAAYYVPCSLADLIWLFFQIWSVCASLFIHFNQTIVNHCVIKKILQVVFSLNCFMIKSLKKDRERGKNMLKRAAKKKMIFLAWSNQFRMNRHGFFSVRCFYCDFLCVWLAHFSQPTKHSICSVVLTTWVRRNGTLKQLLVWSIKYYGPRLQSKWIKRNKMKLVRFHNVPLCTFCMCVYVFFFSSSYCE